MKIGIMLETKELEKSWNALRFAATALDQKHEVKVFFMGEGVEVVELTDEKFDIQKQLEKIEDNGGELLACGTCLKSRKIDDQAACSFSTMLDCLAMVEWADRVLTF